ncbi:MAG: DUF1287 domain-containing protein [Armatimonadetes bacterium]|nr:DUF1287 domain-containing protein [Armatimonadota bacterium]
MIVATILLLQATIPQKLIASARNQLTWGTTYDPSYVSMKYPGGDVDRTKGVCTDVIIRSYRSVHIDLQKLIIEHKRTHMSLYPKGKLDPNIDHRRVKNMAVFFRAKNANLPTNKDWRPGDIVYWILDSGLDHIGLVTDKRGPSGKYMVVHNMSTPLEEDVLGKWRVIGHYRYPK